MNVPERFCNMELRWMRDNVSSEHMVSDMTDTE